jgi:hypothetical protein
MTPGPVESIARDASPGRSHALTFGATLRKAAFSDSRFRARLQNASDSLHLVPFLQPRAARSHVRALDSEPFL